MNRFTEGLAIELGAKSSPVTVQALCPGFTLTEFHDTMGMERSAIPASLWMTADFVVEESLRGFDRRDAVRDSRVALQAARVDAEMLPGALIRWGPSGPRNVTSSRRS